MNNNKKYIGFGLVLVVLAGMVVFGLINQGMGGFLGLWGGGRRVLAPASPRPDDIVRLPQPDGSTVVENKTDGYFAKMPAGWYAEQNAGAGMTVYPDYVPTNTLPAVCKIEVSAFAAASGTDLSGWLSNYLSADPTADISQTSLSGITIANISGLEWRGTMNGATTTLVYAQTGGKIFEIAPSTLREGPGADNDDCNASLQEFLSDFQFGAYQQ